MANDAIAATGFPRNEHYEIEHFRKRFKELSQDALRAEESFNEEAANKHAELAGLTVRFLDSTKSLDANDRAFLQSEVTARVRQAIMLRSVALGGFAEAMLSLGSVRRLNHDLREAKARPENSDDDIDFMAESTDPRTHTEGLYEYMVYDPNAKPDEFPGYEEQHQRIVNAYYVLEDRADDESTENVRKSYRSGGDETLLRSTISRAGSNVILYGPPGTGKTMAARAVAKTLRLDFVFVNSENLSSAYRSETEKNLRKLYVKMRALIRRTGRNVVLLIDEIDGLVKNRSSGEINSSDYSLLTKFLTILEPNDGSDNYGIMSVFTTNRLDNLDDAFLRRCIKIFFGHIVHEDAQLRVLSHFFSSSVHIPLTLGNDVTLETAYRFDNSVAREDDIVRIIEATRDWVPGDFVRFTREVLRPMRLREYLRERGITEAQFYSQISASVSNGNGSSEGRPTTNNRTVNLKLPRITIARLRDATLQYRPTTTTERYNRDFPMEVELENLARARRTRH